MTALLAAAGCLLALFLLRLRAILVPNEGEVEILSRALFGRGGTITGATNASPSVLTFSPGCPPAGTSVVISGATGNTNINGGPFVIYNVSGNNASVASVNVTTGATTPVNGNGTFGGTCVWSLAGTEDLQIRLVSNAHTPAETDTVATYTEVTAGNFSNYSSGGNTLTSSYSTATWAFPTSVAPTNAWSAEAAVAESTQPSITWNATASQTVTGYILVGKVSGKLYGAEQFTSSIGLTNPSTITLTPRFGAS